MQPLDRRAALTLTASAAVAAVAPAWASRTAWPAAPGDMSLGDPKAGVHVVEYLSLSCSHCAHFNETVFPALKAKYVDKGRVYYTARELLTPPENVAAAGFLMARRAGSAKYFTVVDQVLRSQTRWGSEAIKPIFLEIAKQNGLTEAQFDACLVDEQALAALDARIAYAVETEKVDSTPTFFINGERLTAEQVTTFAEFEVALARAVKPKGRR
jgi:protein-disulfide isomerase